MCAGIDVSMVLVIDRAACGQCIKGQLEQGGTAGGYMYILGMKLFN